MDNKKVDTAILYHCTKVFGITFIFSQKVLANNRCPSMASTHSEMTIELKFHDLSSSHGKLIDGYAGSVASNLKLLILQNIHSIIIELLTLVTGLFLLIEPSHAGAHRRVTSNFKTKPRLRSLMVISPFLNQFFIQE